ncbi:hypothetical protein ACFL41_00570 [Gemmatimonadota bacterium]
MLSLICLLAIPRPARAQDSWFGPDKILHFLGGFMVTSFSYMVAHQSFDWDHEKSLQFGVGMGVAASVGKELYDLLSGEGYASGKDLVWDGLGIGLGVILVNTLADSDGGVRPATGAGLQGRYSLRQLSLTPGQPLFRMPEFRLPKPVDTRYIVPTFGLPPGGKLKPGWTPEGD